MDANSVIRILTKNLEHLEHAVNSLEFHIGAIDSSRLESVGARTRIKYYKQIIHKQKQLYKKLEKSLDENDKTEASRIVSIIFHLSWMIRDDTKNLGEELLTGSIKKLPPANKEILH